MMKSGLGSCLLICVSLMCASNLEAYILQESFEGLTGYSIFDPFDDGAFDFFDRYAVPVPIGSNFARDDFQVGWHGNFGLMGQDFEFDSILVEIDPVDVSGFSDLALTVSLGALDDELQGGFDNYELSDGDGILIDACFSGGNCEIIGGFAPPAVGLNTGTAAGDLYLDTDLDGLGDGQRLTRELTDFTFPIEGSGDSLSIFFFLVSTDSFEMIALDNVRLTGVPEPTCNLLCLIGQFICLSSVRRIRF